MTTISDDEILSLWNAIKPSMGQHRVMTRQDGPHCVDKPTWVLRKLVELAVERGREIERKERGQR